MCNKNALTGMVLDAPPPLPGEILEGLFLIRRLLSLQRMLRSLDTMSLHAP
jgi:hypothetical protein